MPEVREALNYSGVMGTDYKKAKRARKLAKRQRQRAAKKARKEGERQLDHIPDDYSVAMSISSDDDASMMDIS